MILLLSILSAICYRCGGLGVDSQDKYSKWIPNWARTSIMRDMPCAFIPCLLLQPDGRFQAIMWLCFFGMSAGFLSTYWDFIMGFDNYWFSGFMLGLSGLFLVGLGACWWLILIRAFALAILWGGWSAIFKDSDIEEYGRGFFLPITMLIVKGV
jgi:hypothetical protein